MPRRVILPDSVTQHAFLVREALAAGVGEGRLRGRDLDSPHHGVRAPKQTRPDQLPEVLRICHDYLPLLGPSRVFSHSTAALLFRAPLPRRFSPALHVAAIAPATPPRRPGVVGHRLTPPVDVITKYGVPLVDASTAFLQLASVLPLDELVVLGDHLVHDPYVLDPHDIRPYVTISELDNRVARWNGRGRRAAVAALALVSAAAESRPETLLRLLLGRAGLPEPEVNPELTGVLRRWTHRADLVYRDRRVIVEYDGDQHRTDTRQYEHDIRRFDDFVEDGWRVVRVRSRGLFVTPTDTVDRVRSALAAGGTYPTASPASTRFKGRDSARIDSQR